METIIKTILGKNTEEYTQYIDLVLDPEKRALISTQEERMFLLLRDSVDNAGQIPTEEYFLIKFPEMTVPLSKAKEISLVDLKVHYANLVKKRTNLEAARALQIISAEVSSTGLTYEHFDKIRGFANIIDTDFIKDVTATPEDFAEFYRKRKEQPIGLQTFVEELDEKIGGIAIGSLFSIVAYTGQYKTMFSANLAYRNAKRLNYNIVIISLEVSKEDYLMNLLCRHSNESKFDRYPYIGHERIRMSELSEDEEDYLFNEITPDFYKEGGAIKILDETDFKTMSFSEIRERLEQIDDELLETKGYGIDAVIVDHVNLCRFNGRNVYKRDDNSEINEYVSFFRKLSLSFRKDKDSDQMRKIAMILLVQANRDGYTKAQKNAGKYELRAIADANEIERASQMIMFIYSDENMKATKEAKVFLAKNRSGATTFDPILINVEAESYVIGDDMNGFNTSIEYNILDSFDDSNIDNILEN